MYRYKDMTIAPQYAEDALNQFGADGWRLAFIAMQDSGLLFIVFEKIEADDGTRKTSRRS